MKWMQSNIDVALKVMPSSVSYHCLLCLTGPTERVVRKSRFKFYNYAVDMEGYNTIVSQSWNKQIDGIPKYVLWEKLKRL